MIFYEDRSDVMRRAMPRLAIGTGLMCLVGAGLIFAADRRAPMPQLLAMLGLIWTVHLLIRFDVFALQFGRRIRNEIDGDSFLAYRGEKQVASFELSRVVEWVAAPSASTWGYWVSWGYPRSAALPAVLPQYSFKVREVSSDRLRTIKPPALFRWEDRGGLDDVTRELIRRLGPPLNYSIDYSLNE